MTELIIAVVSGVIVAAFAAWFASAWALRKFYSERRWERKEKTYINIIDALHDIVQYFEAHKEDYGQGTCYSEEGEKDLYDRYSSAYWKVKKATDIGAFVVSHRVAGVLKDLQKRPRCQSYLGGI